MMNGESGVIFCARASMNLLEASSMQEVKQAILLVPWLASNFDTGENYIRAIDKLVTYAFAGLRHNLDSIKSKARILQGSVDEAETVSEIAWQKLDPTVGEDDSEIWATWNPERDGSITDKRFTTQYPALVNGLLKQALHDLKRSAISLQGFNISTAERWQGSIKDGIAHLCGVDEIIIHPRC